MVMIGRAISKSAHLRELSIQGHRHGLKSFFTWIVRNRSIEHLTIDQIDLSDEDVDIFSIIAPFIEHNVNLRCIEINLTRLGRISSVISALSQCGTNRLERLCLHGNSIGDEGAADLINALTSMPGLHTLVDLELGCNGVGRQGLVALSVLLMHSDCRVHSLALSFNRIDMDCIGILIRGLVKNTSLKTLDICEQQLLDATGWLILMAFVSSPSCSLENIDMTDEKISNECVATLGASLAVNKIMKSLRIGCNEITPTGWQDFFQFLKAPTSTLMDLELTGRNTIDDEIAVDIFSALASNSSLKRFALPVADGITPTGWVSCFRLLIGSKSALEEIYFDLKNIDDEGAAMLIRLISKHMSTVRKLDVSGNTDITTEGWRLFAEVFPAQPRN